MQPSSLIESIYHSGYCLWVGAGVTSHISSIAKPSPEWSDLVTRLETEAKVDPSADPFDVRLARCWKRLGLVAFQSAIRRHIHLVLATAILDWSEANRGNVPLPARQVATLARGANAIVNFNIEAGTSCLMGGAIGSYSVKTYESPLITRLLGSNLWWTGGGSGAPRVGIVHPHGALETGSLCVLTRDDYVQMNGTLALELAVHAAFRETLVIVGMSLGDEYLREQILRFRSQIGRIYWVRAETDRLDSATEGWVRSADIVVTTARTWSDVWTEIDKSIVGKRRASRSRLAQAWLQAIEWACKNDQIYPSSLDDSPSSLDDSPLSGLQAGARALPIGLPPSTVGNPRWEPLRMAYQDALKS